MSEWDAFPAVKQAAPQQAQQPDEWAAYPKVNLSTDEMLSGAYQNFVPSLKQFGNDMLQPIMHPINTATSMWGLGKGILQKVIPGEQPEEVYADRLAQLFIDRYGSIEQAKQTFATDPVGFASDISMFLTGGGTAAAKLPGIAGKVGRATAKVGTAIDPAAGALKIAGKAASYPLGMTTGVGPTPIMEAGKAGAKGGDAASAFQAGMRNAGETSEALVKSAEDALDNMKAERAAEYRADKKQWSKDIQVWGQSQWDQIDKAIEKIGSPDTGRTFRGRSGTGPVQVLDKQADTARNRAYKIVEDWKKLDPAEYHTVEGMDALKQRLGAEMRKLGWKDETASARKVYGEVYNTISKEIEKHAPGYHKAMKGYAEATKQIDEVRKTLSLSPGASVDTKLRKLQSVMRNNVNTNYGRRSLLVKKLEKAGAKNLVEGLAGQSMSGNMPRGFGNVISGGGGVGVGVSALAGAFNPYSLLLAPAAIPRVVGEGAYYAGKFHKPAGSIMFQSGRLTRDENEEFF